MRIVEQPPNWIRFTCQKCKGVYEIEKSDVVTAPTRDISYGQYYATIRCPICGQEDHLSYDLFPSLWIKELQK